jgi:hypothetical protein
MTFRIAGLCSVFALAACLAGCAVEPASQAMMDAYRLVRSEGGTQSSVRGVNPDFNYLRVQVGARELFMVLGYVDQTPDGPVQVWYSANADVLRLRDGRLVGATMKTGTDWLAVSFSHLPSWNAVGSQAAFERVRDVSPGYRYGIKEKMLIRRIAPPDDSRLQLVPPSSLSWFEEVVQGDVAVRPARYAVSLDGVGTHHVVYAEQCLSSEFCFSWQNWPSSKKGTH